MYTNVYQKSNQNYYLEKLKGLTDHLGNLAIHKKAVMM